MLSHWPRASRLPRPWNWLSITKDDNICFWTSTVLEIHFLTKAERSRDTIKRYIRQHNHCAVLDLSDLRLHTTTRVPSEGTSMSSGWWIQPVVCTSRSRTRLTNFFVIRFLSENNNALFSCVNQHFSCASRGWHQSERASFVSPIENQQLGFRWPRPGT